MTTLSILSLATAALSAAAPQTRELTISACEGSPVLDGALGDACWRSAGRAGELRFLKSRLPAPVTAWATYDSCWFYCAVEVHHPKPRQIISRCTVHDGPVSRDDSVELFFDPGTGGRAYYHFMLNVANVRAEQRVSVTNKGIVRDRGWDVPWRSATLRTTKGWNAEIALPLAAMAHGDLAKARMNLCGLVIDPVIDPHGIRVDEKRQLICWAPVGKSFHEPESFGIVRGLAPGKVELPLLVAFSDAKVGQYDVSRGQCSFPVTVSLRNHSPKPGVVELLILDKPISGKPSEVRRRVRLKPKEQKRLGLTVPVASFAERAVTIVLRDTDTGEALQTQTIAETESLSLMSAYLDRNYYTDEPDATVVCALGVPQPKLVGTTLVVTDAGGRRLASLKEVTAKSRLSVPIGGMACGSHSLTAALCDGNGSTMFSRQLKLVKKKLSPVLEVKIDHINRVVLRNGKPFLPFGVVLPSKDERDFAYIADLGFNSFVQWHAADAALAKDMVAWAEKHGLHMLASLDNLMPAGSQKLGRVRLKYLAPDPKLPEAERQSRYEAEYAAKITAARKIIDQIETSPNLLAYFNIDEPADTRWVRRACKGIYDLVHEADGYRPVHLNTGSYDFDVFRDILGGDPYWSPATTNPRRNDPTAALRYCYGYPYRDYVRTAKKLRMPLWKVPLGEVWSGIHKRAILPQEQLCQTYLLMIHGVRGFFYFVYPFTHEATYGVMRRLAKEVKALSPCLMAPDVSQTITYSPGEMGPWDGRFPDVHVVLRRRLDGEYVLLVANPKYYPVDASFGVSFLGEGAAATRLFANDQCLVRDGAFGERIEGYGVRAYVVQGPVSTDRPVEISVRMTPHPELAEPEEPEIPRTGRPGRKNLVQNPGFEQATFPGWPDYYRLHAYSQLGPSIAGPEGRWYLDPSQPFEGHYSLRMQVHERRISHIRMGFVFYLTPSIKEPTPFTYSLHTRAKGTDMKVQFIAPNMQVSWYRRPAIPLSDTWQRHSITTVVQPRRRPYNVYGLVVYGEGTVWVDGVQVEKGEKATELDP